MPKYAIIVKFHAAVVEILKCHIKQKELEYFCSGRTYLDVAAVWMSQYERRWHHARNLLLRNKEQRVVENRIQEQTHHNDRFVFAKFVNEEACGWESGKMASVRENVSEIAVRRLETASSGV